MLNKYGEMDISKSNLSSLELKHSKRRTQIQTNRNGKQNPTIQILQAF